MESANDMVNDPQLAPPANWGQERRLEFIEFRVLWEGRINRGELVAFFGISIQQASLDLARYMELAPTNLHYDKSAKQYGPSVDFKPVFSQPDSLGFLNQLLGQATGQVPAQLSYIGRPPPFDVVRYPTRSIRTDILLRVIWAIRDREEIDLSYQSMRRPQATRRWISPHAIAFDGTRWHARAWCHENGYFKDFVLARIQLIHGSRRAEIDPQQDLRWHSYATLAFRAHPDLTPAQRLAVETEFGMRDGALQVSLREALVLYFIRQLRLDAGADSHGGARALEWVNENEFASLLLEADRK